MAGVNDNLRPKPFTSETAREAGRKGGFYPTPFSAPCKSILCKPLGSITKSELIGNLFRG